MSVRRSPRGAFFNLFQLSKFEIGQETLGTIGFRLFQVLEGVPAGFFFQVWKSLVNIFSF